MSSSASRRARRCAKGSSERSRGTASTPARLPARRRELASGVRSRAARRRRRAARGQRDGRRLLSVRPAYVLGAPRRRAVARRPRLRPDRHATTGGSTTRAATSSGTTPGAYLLAHGHLPPASWATAGRCCCCRSHAFAGPNLVSALPAIVLFNTWCCCRSRCSASTGSPPHRRAAVRLLRRRALDRAPLPRNPVRRAGLPPEVHRADAAAGRRAHLRAGLPVRRSRCSSARTSACGRSTSASWHAGRGTGLAAGYVDRDQAVERDLPRRARIAAARSNAGARCSPFVVGLAPALLTLALWKYRGLGRARRCTRGAGAARAGVGRPARPNSQPEPEQLGSSTPGARRVARALLGRARDRMAAGRGRDRAARALATRVPAGRQLVRRRSCWSRARTFRHRIDDASFFRILHAGVPRLSSCWRRRSCCSFPGVAGPAAHRSPRSTACKVAGYRRRCGCRRRLRGLPARRHRGDAAPARRRTKRACRLGRHPRPRVVRPSGCRPRS